MFTHYWKILVLNFLGIEGNVFLSQKDDGNMIFTDYWKVVLLNFSEMGNTVLFEPGRWWKGNIHGLLKTCSFEIIGDGKCIFLSQKADGEIILVWFFFSFPWYFRIWEKWFFVQCSIVWIVSKLKNWTFGFWKVLIGSLIIMQFM